MDSSQKSYNKIWILIPALISFGLILFSLFIPILYSDNENDSAVFSNAIDMVTLITTIVSLYYLIKTLQSQQEQINQNKTDIEFDRAINFISNQTKITVNRKKKDIESYQDVIKESLKLIYDNEDLDNQDNLFKNLEYKDNLRKVIRRLRNHSFSLRMLMKPYIRMIFQQNFGEKEIFVLINVFNDSDISKWLSNYLYYINVVKNSLEDYHLVLGEEIQMLGLMEKYFNELLEFESMIESIYNDENYVNERKNKINTYFHYNN